MKYFLILLLMGFACGLQAVPYHGEKRLFTQPDGSTVWVKLFGDEFYMRGESENGYTLMRDPQTGWICYARISEDGSTLVSTGIRFSNNDATWQNSLAAKQLPKHIDISEKDRLRISRQNKRSLETCMRTQAEKETRGTPITLVSGKIKGLCIVIDFPDQPGMVPLAEFNAFCNDTNYNGYGNKGSLRTYYRDISGGIVDYENVVFGYYHAPHTFSYYDSLPYAQGARMILDSALHWIAAQGFDFSTLSLNPDNTIRAINMMYTGVPLNWAQGMWHHKGSYSGFTANGVRSKDYNCSPANEPLRIAVVAHENGHMIGKWPDTYKYTNDHGDDGIGTFDLMCWPGNDQTNPVPPNPLFRSNAGWGKVIDITGFNGINFDTANAMTCYRYINMNDTNEMFLIENRLKKNRSQQIEDQGLTIWHIDRNGNNQTTHHEVFLEHANNDSTKDNQACFKAGFNNEFGRNSLPNSNFYNGDPSGLRVWDIGDTLSPVMPYKLGKAQAAPSLRLKYVSITDDDNGNGTVEPGESFRFNLQAMNLGQINAVNTKVKAAAIGNTVNQVQIENPEVPVGMLQSGEALPLSFRATVNSQTAVGTELTFRFTISDGSDSIYVTKTLVAGNILLMNNEAVTTCAAVLYDDGGTGIYKNNKHYSKTIRPEDPRKPLMISFQEFDTEGGAHCDYDYLKIFDGTDSTAPMINRWCNTTSPGVIKASNQDGALTLVWHSDEEDGKAGWKAVLSCQYDGDVIPDDELNIFPNPGNGLFTIRAYGEKIQELGVYNVLGDRVRSYVGDAVHELKIDMHNQLNGLYLFKVKTGPQWIIRKISLQR